MRMRVGTADGGNLGHLPRLRKGQRRYILILRMRWHRKANWEQITEPSMLLIEYSAAMRQLTYNRMLVARHVENSTLTRWLQLGGWNGGWYRIVKHS